MPPDWPDYLDSFRSALQPPREEPGLAFPALSARQKQFALSPAHPDFYRRRPDFLQFRLQELDDSEGPLEEQRRKEGLLEQELEQELEAVLGRRGEGGGEAGAGADPGPRAGGHEEGAGGRAEGPPLHPGGPAGAGGRRPLHQ